MSVQPVMVDVHRPAITLLVVTTVHVVLATLWPQTIMAVMVCASKFRNKIKNILKSIQMSMSVALTLVDATRSVPTLLAAFCAHVILDMSWILMQELVLVSEAMIQIFNNILFQTPMNVVIIMVDVSRTVTILLVVTSVLATAVTHSIQTNMPAMVYAYAYTRV